MYSGIDQLVGQNARYGDRSCTIVNCGEKSGRPILIIKYQDDDSKPAEIKTELVDGRTAELLSFDADNPDRETLNNLVLRIADEYVRSHLISSYNKTYRAIKGDGKDVKYSPAFSREDKANLQRTLRFAIDGLPEAIYELCNYHVKYAKAIENFYSPKVLTLFGYGDKSKNLIRCSFSDVFEFGLKDKALQKMIIEQREIVICGTDDGFYGEDGVTWNHIEKNILPIATADIWDTLYEFFNRPDAIVDPMDKELFNAQSKEKYILPLEPESDTGMSRSVSSPIAFSEIVDNTLSLISKEEFNEVKRMLSGASERQKTAIAYAVAVKGINSVSCDDSDWDKLLKRCQKIITQLPEKRAKKLMAELNFEEQTGTVAVIRSQGRTSLSADWETALKECFEKSLSTDTVRWWIGTLDSFNILMQYSRELGFWDGLKPSAIMLLINQFFDSLIPERFLAFAEELCLQYIERGRATAEACRCWKRFLLRAMSDLPITDKSARIFSSTLLRVYTKEELPALMEEMFYLLEGNRKESPKSDLRENGRDLAEKLVAQMRGFAEAEEALNERRLFNSENDASITAALRRILNIKKDLSYLAEHEWNMAIRPVVGEVAFLDFSDIPFDSSKHVSDNEISDGTMVKALSSGIELDGKVKYKAVVVKSRGGK